ncbi:MAG: hypothetical protein RLZZ282_224, partial [Verrucomicrobiota bacterium]
MTMRALGIGITLIAALAITGEALHIALPTGRWFFETSRQIPWLHTGRGFPWFGWLSTVLLAVCGLTMVTRSLVSGPRNPLSVRRIRRFCEIKRGYYSLLILLALGGLAMLDQVVVGKRALAVHYHGRWLFPAFACSDLKNKDLGITGAPAEAPVNYRQLKKSFQALGDGRVILPPIPYDPTGDTLPPRSRALIQNDGLYYEIGSRHPYSGLAAKYDDVAEAKIHLRYTLRHGRLSGPVEGWNPDGMPVYHADYLTGKLLTEHFLGEGSQEAFLQAPVSELRAIKYHPAPPMPEEGNWLGTTSQGYDVLAYLYGGLQVNFKAALIYLPIVYLIGVTLGMMMGFFGGWFDLAAQRLIEVFSNMPFLFVVIIFSSMVPDS